jgi:sterol desaturase/sphingolipid hydroxylase (fatty acid hydroxylase superfamily)
MRRVLTSSVVLGLLVAVLFVVGFKPAAAVVLGFAILTPLEVLFRRHQQPVRRKGLHTDVVHFLFTGLLNSGATLVGVVVVYVSLHWLTIASVQSFILSTPAVVQFLLALAIFEVGGYWYHRWSHEVPFLWRFHAVHHSSENLDWISAARLHPLEGFFAGLVIGPALVVLGFRPITVPLVSVALTLWAILLHANIRWRLRPLDGIIGTPEYHHWHHSNHADAWNHNYSGLLPPLDRVFGTYYQPTHKRPETYGTDDHIPDGWFAQLLHPLRRAEPISVSRF